MTRRAFDTHRQWRCDLFVCLETRYSHVLEPHTVPATKWNGPRKILRGPFLCLMGVSAT